MIKDVLNQIEAPLTMINTKGKLLPYVTGKVKPIEKIERDYRNIVIDLVPYDSSNGLYF